MKRIIKISEYSYGRIYKKLKLAANFINKNQNKIKSDLINGKLDFFDYPDYWNLPKKIANILNSDEVDFIQDQVYDFYQKYVRDSY